MKKPVAAAEAPAETPEITVLFSPDGGCTRAVVREITKAEKSVVVLAYHLTSLPIATALGEAKGRGVDVTAILDGSALESEQSQAAYLNQHGVSVFTDSTHGLLNEKVAVIDDKVVMTGSFTYAEESENSNAENLIIIRKAPDVVLAFKKNCIRHLVHSDQFVPAVSEGEGIKQVASTDEAEESCCK